MTTRFRLAPGSWKPGRLPRTSWCQGGRLLRLGQNLRKHLNPEFQGV